MSYDDLKKYSDDDLREIIQNYKDVVNNRYQYSADIATLERSPQLTEEQEKKLQELKNQYYLIQQEIDQTYEPEFKLAKQISNERQVHLSSIPATALASAILASIASKQPIASK